MEQPASFRDPAGRCYLVEGRVLRWISAEHAPAFETFLESPLARRFASERRLISSRKLTPTERAALGPMPGLAAHDAAAGEWFEHERVLFPSYPSEWPTEMLHAAGRLTLDLAQAALADGYGLKDATPYNVLFRGPDPVFIDVPSFEKRVPGEPVWKPYAQFARTFLLPLLACQRWGLPLADVFTTRRDGLEPEAVYRWCSPLQRLCPPFLGLVTLPTWLARRAQDPATYQERRLADPEKAQFILEVTLKRLARALARVAPKDGGSSAWADYMATHSYSDAAFQAKEEFVRAALAEGRPRRVLDVGANTGHFSALAATAGASVVAIDSDARCVGAIWRRAVAQKLDLLPLVVDFARPTPPLGWRNRELPSFLDRARGGFDAVLMLAVLHHLLVTERVPLEEVLELAAELTTAHLVIEWVGPQDPMFRQIARGRDHLHADLTVEGFEQAARQRFEVLRSLQLGDSHRRLYWLRKR